MLPLTILIASAPMQLVTGDIILESSSSPQSRAIAAATHSPITHAGVVVVEDGATWVYEAVGPVQRTPLAKFIARAKNAADIVVRRVPNLDDDRKKKIVAAARRYLGTPYDFAFAPGADKLYCSEYVRLVFAAAGVDVGKVEHVRDLDVADPLVQKMFAARWREHPACNGAQGAPRASTLAECEPRLLASEIVTPASLANDARLVPVAGSAPLAGR